MQSQPDYEWLGEQQHYAVSLNWRLMSSLRFVDYADQRYYSNQFGRFMSPDPYKASSAGSDPQSWNRYTYVGNDPTNYGDRSGLFRSIIGTCDDLVNGAPQLGCDYGDDEGPYAHLTGYDCGTPGMSFSNSVDGCIADSSGEEPQQAARSPIVTSLHIILDCWLSFNTKTGGPSRETTFEAFSGNTPLGGQDVLITEAVTTSPGGPLATKYINDPASQGTGGVFADEKGQPLKFWGPLTLYQSFTVAVDGGLAYSVPVLMGGTSNPYLTVNYTWNYGSVLNWLKGKKDYNVIVNGQGKDQLPLCNP